MNADVPKEDVPTLLATRKSSREIAGLAIDAVCVAHHLEEEASLAQEAELARAIGPDVALSELAYWPDESKDLQ